MFHVHYTGAVYPWMAQIAGSPFEVNPLKDQSIWGMTNFSMNLMSRETIQSPKYIGAINSSQHNIMILQRFSSDKDVMLYLGHFGVVLQVLLSLLLIQHVDTVTKIVQAVATSLSLGRFPQQFWSSYSASVYRISILQTEHLRSPKKNYCPAKGAYSLEA